MIDLEERQLLAQTVFALTRCSASPSNCRHPLTQTQIEPLYEGCIDPPAADGQDLLIASCVPNTTRCFTSTMRRRLMVLTTCA